MSHKRLILIISLLLPVAVSGLYFMPKFSLDTVDFLPMVNAYVNGGVFLILILALVAIKKGNRQLHMKFMYSALILSVIFLISYVMHHATHDTVSYDGEGFLRFFYYFILITHIVLAIAIVPMVLISFSRALKEQFYLHKRIARITMPLWLYVSLTGVIVYLMISPFYPWAYTVSGKIKSQNHQELIGVNISVENLSDIVSTTDVNGNYSISLL